MIFKAVTVLLPALCSSLALIPQLTPGLFIFNLLRLPITFPCCDPALRQCATQSEIGELSPQPKLYVPTLNYRHVTSVFRNVMLSILEYMDPFLGHTEASNEYHSSQANF
jgi:hypothetical protein